mmetsp:Transcript_9992/g.14066  ORF Transcript_9992/g.14066 Transcript_9992/m.14066 type:complete len:212 (+) Transcript_9992:177-812(+)
MKNGCTSLGSSIISIRSPVKSQFFPLNLILLLSKFLTTFGLTSYLCLCLSLITSDFSSSYNFLAKELGKSFVSFTPKRIVPPFFSLSPSGINTTTFSHSFNFSNSPSLQNSWLLDLAIFNTLRPNSIIAACIPIHIPKNGILFSRAYFIADIFPSKALSPNPPGTKIPSHFFNLSHASFPNLSSLSNSPQSSKLAASIQSMTSFLLQNNEA